MKRAEEVTGTLLLLFSLAGLASCSNADDLTFTPFRASSNQADLSGLTLSSGALNPAFSSSATDYTTMFIGTSSVTVTPTAAESHATIAVNGTVVASGQASPLMSLALGETTLTIVVRAQDGVTTRTYSVVAHRLWEDAYLKASNTDAGDQFGYSVAASGNTLAVGAPFEASAVVGTGGGNQLDNSLPQSGAVYVFTRANGVWSQQAYLKPSNTGAVDRFGSSVALSGDTLAVGAPTESSNATGVNGNQANNSASNSGAVYVFVRTNNEWSQQAYLKASNTDPEDRFGASVALSGDTLAVGAVGESSSAVGINGNQADNSLPFSGAAYVFTRFAGIWSQQAYVKASNPGGSDLFGASVALSGDVLAIGAIHERSAATGVNGDQTNNGAGNSGAVYLFTRAGGLWTQEAFLKASNTEGNDGFGASLALSGDTLAVGAKAEDSRASGVNGDQADNGALDSGAVYVFTRVGGMWSQQAYLKASNTDAGDQFGASLILEGDVLVVGAPYEDSLGYGVNPGPVVEVDNSASNSGAIYVFTRTGGVWKQDAFVKSSDTRADNWFGFSVAVAGDLLAVGSTGESRDAFGVNNANTDGAGAPNSGAVYVYR